MKGTFIKYIIVIIVILIGMSACGQSIREDNGDTIYFSVMTDPPEAKLYYRLVSSTNQVKSTNREYLGRTPYKQAMNLKALGVEKDNAEKVSLVLEIEKSGYYERIERFDLVGILNAGELSILHHLNKKEGQEEEKSLIFPPGDLRASTGTEKEYVRLNWTKVEGVKGYNVYRDTEIKGNFTEKIALVQGEEYLDRIAEVGQKYYYRIKSFNEKGESEFSGISLGYKSVDNSSKNDKKDKKKDQSTKGKDEKPTSSSSNKISGDLGTSPGVPGVPTPPISGAPPAPKAPPMGSEVPPVSPPMVIPAQGLGPASKGVNKSIKKIISG